MEPANFHHQHHLQEHFAGNYSSLLFEPESNKFSNINNLYPGFILESWAPNGSFNMFQGLTSFTQQSADELLLSKIKEEIPDSFPKLSEMTFTGPSDIEESHSLSIKHQHSHDDLGGHNQFHTRNNSFSSGHHNHDHTTELQLSAGKILSESAQILSSASNKNDFNHTLPSLHNLNSYLRFPLVPSSLDLNLQALDLLTPTYDATSQNNNGFCSIEQLKASPSSSSNKVSSTKEGVDRKRRHISSFPESKNFPREVKNKNKNKNPPSQPSCPPSKVKKEKVREKIATLQRLVAPYGKTDTASVLTDVIGYIQFLHDQVQALSVPYMKSSKRKPTRTRQANMSEEDMIKGQPKRDLSDRGLCLVPTSCASFVNNCNGRI